MLTTSDRQLLQRVFAQGPAALAEAGYSPDEARAFLLQEEVQREWHALQHEFDKQEIVFGHTKFILRRQLTRLGPGATAVLASALAGPEYARNDSGTILTDAKGHPILLAAETSPMQMSAAKDVLDRLDVIASARDETMRANINILFHKDRPEEVEVQIDPGLETEEERALSRERVRNVIERIQEHLPALRSAAIKMIEGKAPKNGNGQSKKKQTKKATKKPVKTIKKKQTKKATKKATKKRSKRTKAKK